MAGGGGGGAWFAVNARFKYAWLRCTAHGFKCVPIRKATKFRYHLTKRDAGHRLRVRVSARNLAGRKTGTSAASQRVKFKL